VPRGGCRQGAGRPAGSLTRRTRESIATAERYGISPLEVMLEAMLAARAEGRRMEAFEYALAAAPYVHPKPSSSGMQGDAPLIDMTVLTDEELDEMGRLLKKIEPER